MWNARARYQVVSECLLLLPQVDRDPKYLVRLVLFSSLLPVSPQVPGLCIEEHIYIYICYHHHALNDNLLHRIKRKKIERGNTVRSSVYYDHRVFIKITKVFKYFVSEPMCMLVCVCVLSFECCQHDGRAFVFILPNLHHSSYHRG